MAYIEYKAGVAAANVRRFRDAFGGDFFYAVKANPTRALLEDFLHSGIAGFDVASVTEIECVREVSRTVPIICTHPVKTRDEIAAAFGTWGVRSFVVDSARELQKIKEICTIAELEVFVRVRTIDHSDMSNGDAREKFGASLEKAAVLLRDIRNAGATPSVSFHLGFSPTDSSSYRQVVTRIARMLDRHSLSVNRISIGGGFPMPQPRPDGAADRDCIPSAASLQGVHDVLRTVEFIAEPGRALAGTTMDLVVEVLLAEDGRVFIDDGVYTTLLDSAVMGKVFRISVETPGKSPATAPVTIFGRTCDSLDRLPGRYDLPVDLKDGDRLRIACVGAYGTGLTQNFNGLSTAPPLHRLA